MDNFTVNADARDPARILCNLLAEFLLNDQQAL